MQKLKRSEAGNAMVEFALSWALISLLFTGIFQYGYTIYVYNCLVTAVQNGAEAGAMMTWDKGDDGAAFRTAVQNMVVYGTPTAGTDPIVPGLTPANVLVNENLTGPSGNLYPTNITVSIQNYQVNAIFGTRTLNKPRVSAVFMGSVACTGASC